MKHNAASPDGTLVSVYTPEPTGPELLETSWPPNLPWLRFSAQFPQVNGDLLGKDTGGSELLPQLALRTGKATSLSGHRVQSTGWTGLAELLTILPSLRQPVRIRRLAADMALYMPGPPDDHRRRSQALSEGRPGLSCRPFLGILVFLASNNMLFGDDWDGVFAMIRESGWLNLPSSELPGLGSTEPTIAAFLEKLFQESFFREKLDIISWLLGLGVSPDTYVRGKWGHRQHLPIIAVLEIGNKYQDGISQTSLHIMRLLKRHGASFTKICCGNHQTAIYYAARSGSLEAFQMFDIQQDWDYASLVDSAAECPDEVLGGQMIQHLLSLHESSSRACEDVFTKARTATTLVFLAARGRDTMLQLLHDKGANFNCHDRFYFFPLSEAAKRGRESTCRLLLRLGASVNYIPIRGDGRAGPSVLHLARDHTEVCELLLQYGAETLLQYGVEPLLQHSAETWHPTGVRSETPILLALRMGSFKCARLLAQYDVQLNEHELLPVLWHIVRRPNPAVLAVLDVVYSKLGLSRTLYWEVAIMRHIITLQSLIKQGNVGAIAAQIGGVLHRSITSTDHLSLMRKAFQTQNLNIIQVMLDTSRPSPLNQARLLKAAIQTGCSEIIYLMLKAYPEAYSFRTLCEAIGLLSTKADGAQHQINVLLERRQKVLIDTWRGTQAIGLAVRHAVMTGDFELLHDLDPEAKHNVCLVEGLWGRTPYTFRTSPLFQTLFKHENIPISPVLDYLKLKPSEDPKALKTLLRIGYKSTTFLGNQAVEMGLLDHLELLLANGFNPRRRYAWSCTVLQCAVHQNNIPIIKCLLRHGADVNARPQWRKYYNEEEYGSFFLTHDQGDHFVSGPRPPRTALQSAVETGNMEIITLLIENGADVNEAPGSNRGATALQLACIHGFIGIAKFLLSKSANPNAAGAAVHGRTALQGAAENGRLDLVYLLLNEGCLINDSHREQFIHAVRLARNEGHMIIAAHLQDYGDWTSEDEDLLNGYKPDRIIPIEESFSDEEDVSDIENPSGIEAQSIISDADSYDSDCYSECAAWSDSIDNSYSEPKTGDDEDAALFPELNRTLNVVGEDAPQNPEDTAELPLYSPITGGWPGDATWEGVYLSADMEFGNLWESLWSNS